MIIFGILAVIIVGALAGGQARRVLRSWQSREAGWSRPAKLSEEPIRFWILFVFEISLFVAVAYLFLSYVLVVLSL